MQQRESMAAAVPERRASRVRRLLIGAVAVVAAGAVWVAMHRGAGPAQVVEVSASAPTPAPAGASASPNVRIAAPAMASSASSRVAAASAPFVAPVESAAESLRKVQLALSGGTAEDDLVAATTLESCAHADKTATDLIQGRDTVKLLPPEARKILDKLPPVSDEMIARAQREQRRCQVFDAATLAGRGDLFRRAYERGAEGAAQFYLTWLTSDDAPAKPDPDLVARLRAGVRADAQAGVLPTLAFFAYGGRYAAGEAAADPVQANAYKEAYFRIFEELAPGQSPSPRDIAAGLPSFGPTEPTMTEQQQRQAEALTLQILSSWHRRRNP